MNALKLRGQQDHNAIIENNFLSTCCHQQKIFGYSFDQKAWVTSVQSVTLWQQATIEITCHNHSIIAHLYHLHISAIPIFVHIPFHSGCFTMPHWLIGCNNIPSYKELHWSHGERCTWHGLHVLITAIFCCNQQAWAESVQSFTLWEQASIKITWLLLVGTT